MNSCYRSSEEDYDYLKARILSIGQYWEKLTQVFNAHMRKLNEGILFQLTTIMKTFTDGEIDHAYEVLTNTESEIYQVNSYVRMINFLGKKNLQDVDTIKNYSDVMAEKVKRIIGKTVKKIELLLDKMQQHICELDFTKLDYYRLGYKEENESRLKLETFDERTDNDNTNEDSNSGKKTKDQKYSKYKDTKKSNSQSKNKDKNEAEEVPKIGFQKYK